jgi:hypothetical protein
LALSFRTRHRSVCFQDLNDTNNITAVTPR